MRHRDDIDGLRAVAVVAVVLFHFGFTRRLDGGFVGVDVFFVISGYLITGIVERDIAAGRFSLVQFYNRRVRRIFPALLPVYVFCAVAAAALLFPSEAAAVYKQLLSSLGFVSNVFFFFSSGYFDKGAKRAPLLHTWSLSVEEQFYIVLPLLLFALRKVQPRLRLATLATLAAISFGAAVWMVRSNATRAFYLVEFRGWELLVGSLLALRPFPALTRRAPAELLGGVGLALVGASVFTINSTTPFPGLAAVPACLGAAAIIYSGEAKETLTSRVLGAQPFRFIGLVSYSFYLWHWPVLIFYTMNRANVGRSERFGLLVATFAISVLSWRFVEQPFRRAPFRLPPARTLAMAAASWLAMAAFALSLGVAITHWFPAPPQVEKLLGFLGYDPVRSMRADLCFLSSESKKSSINRDVCLAQAPGKKSYLLMGDSHAAHLWPGFEQFQGRANVLQATSSGCIPVHHASGERRCTQLFSYIFDEFLPAHHLDGIIISGRWQRADADSLRATLDYLRPFADRVVVLGPIVEYDQALPRLLAYAAYRHDPHLLQKHRDAKVLGTDELLAQRVRGTGAEYVSVYRLLCPANECTVTTEAGVPLQFDSTHLTPDGARFVVKQLQTQLFGATRALNEP